MRSLIAAAGALWIAVIMWDAFEAIVLPRRVTRRLRPARLFYRVTWRMWSAVPRRMRPGGRRETFLSFYGPLSLLVLLAAWAASLVIAFAMVQVGIGTRLSVAGGGAFLDHLYLSGETFFTLGLGDVTPTSRAGRAVMVIEAGVGFGFLALVIGYLPVLYQAFSRRELNITLLDARAGSPPSAEELLRGFGAYQEELAVLLAEWERWGADVLESHLSYPVLSYYRSQHDNQSWLAALTTVLDASVLVMVGIEGACSRQAGLTFAMARHAVVDLAQVLSRPPVGSAPDRLTSSELARLRTGLAAAGVVVPAGDAEDKLAELRRMYEPYVAALAQHLLMPLPAWRGGAEPNENWRTSAWGRPLGGAQSRSRSVDPGDD
ncbi:MAG: two pore domain potassium channel family protein [Candidatus Rokuibacteriota bacterium]|nr:MAG: two pore domain potassium channel family protein [Candidatus Rokubacteria bacterium]